MMWYSNMLCTGRLVVAALLSASVCSSLGCTYEELYIDGKCSTSNNCTDRSKVHFLNPKYEISCIEILKATRHICKYKDYNPNVELGVKIPGPNEKEYYRVLDDHMHAESNPEDASRARIGMKEIGPYKGAWCAGNDTGNDQKWLEVNFDMPVDIEKIEIKGHPTDPSKWVEWFYLEYLDESGSLVPYHHFLNFQSSPNGSCHYVFISQTKGVRVFSNSPASRTCMQLAIYGKRTDSLPIKVVVVPEADPTSKYQKLYLNSISNKEFFKGYMLWAVYVALLIFLVIFTFIFLFCWCCRRDYPLNSAMERSREANPDYVSAWRRIDAKAEKGYVATREAQEVKIAFTDEYIPPGLQKEKQDATDEKFYKHKIFSFSGCQPANAHMAHHDHPEAAQENGATSK